MTGVIIYRNSKADPSYSLRLIMCIPIAFERAENWQNVAELLALIITESIFEISTKVRAIKNPGLLGPGLLHFRIIVLCRETVLLKQRTLPPDFLLKFNDTINFGMQAVIFTSVYIFTSIMFCASLANNNITSNSCLTTIYLNSKSFRFRLSSVFRTTYTLLMCHDVIFLKLILAQCFDQLCLLH